MPSGPVPSRHTVLFLLLQLEQPFVGSLGFCFPCGGIVRVLGSIVAKCSRSFLFAALPLPLEAPGMPSGGRAG